MGQRVASLVGGEVDDMVASRRQAAADAWARRRGELAEVWALEAPAIVEAARAAAPGPCVRGAGHLLVAAGSVVPALVGVAAGLALERAIAPLAWPVSYLAGATLGEERIADIYAWVDGWACSLGGEGSV